jgi:hypothetical protein
MQNAPLGLKMLMFLPCGTAFLFPPRKIYKIEDLIDARYNSAPYD